MLENIQNLCKERGIPISRLEKELGFSNGSIYKWDKTSPSVDKVIKVASFFNVTIEEILDLPINVDLSERVRLITMELSQGPYGHRTFRPEAIDPIAENLKHLENKYDVKTPQTAEDVFDLLYNSKDEGFLVEVLRSLEMAKEQITQASQTNYKPETIAAHHDGEDWTEEELEDIERFKEFVRSKRKHQE